MTKIKNINPPPKKTGGTRKTKDPGSSPTNGLSDKKLSDLVNMVAVQQTDGPPKTAAFAGAKFLGENWNVLAVNLGGIGDMKNFDPDKWLDSWDNNTQFFSFENPKTGVNFIVTFDGKGSGNGHELSIGKQIHNPIGIPHVADMLNKVKPAMERLMPSLSEKFPHAAGSAYFANIRTEPMDYASISLNAGAIVLTDPIVVSIGADKESSDKTKKKGLQEQFKKLLPIVKEIFIQVMLVEKLKEAKVVFEYANTTKNAIAFVASRNALGFATKQVLGKAIGAGVKEFSEDLRGELKGALMEEIQQEANQMFGTQIKMQKVAGVAYREEFSEFNQATRKKLKDVIEINVDTMGILKSTIGAVAEVYKRDLGEFNKDIIEPFIKRVTRPVGEYPGSLEGHNETMAKYFCTKDVQAAQTENHKMDAEMIAACTERATVVLNRQGHEATLYEAQNTVADFFESMLESKVYDPVVQREIEKALTMMDSTVADTGKYKYEDYSDTGPELEL